MRTRAFTPLSITVVCTLISAHAAWADATPHRDEIEAFATIMTMAKTASDRCKDILVNMSMLEKAPGFFHMTQADQDAFKLAASAESERLAATIEAAPGMRTWCDEAYRLYGPDGDVVRGLLKR